MNILKKLLRIPHYPATFKGYVINYNYTERCRLCNRTAYGAYGNKRDISMEIPPVLFYCPHCQKLFGIPQTAKPIVVL